VPESLDCATRGVPDIENSASGGHVAIVFPRDEAPADVGGVKPTAVVQTGEQAQHECTVIAPDPRWLIVCALTDGIL